MKVWQVTCITASPVPKGKRDAEPTKIFKETTPRCFVEKSQTRRRISGRIPLSALFACCFCLRTWTFRFFARAHCRSVFLRFRLPDGRREKLVYPFVLRTNLRKKKKEDKNCQLHETGENSLIKTMNHGGRRLHFLAARRTGRRR